MFMLKSYEFLAKITFLRYPASRLQNYRVEIFFSKSTSVELLFRSKSIFPIKNPENDDVRPILLMSMYGPYKEHEHP